MSQSAYVSDVELIHRVVAGDSDAADVFVARFTRLVWWVLVHQLRLAPESAADVYQDVFVRLWQDNYRPLRNWTGDGDFSAYLIPIVRNLALDRTRSKHPERHARLPDADEPGREPEDPAPGAGELAWIDQQRELLDQAVTALDPQNRELYELRFVEECNYSEIGARLGITISNVGVRLSRLVDRLRAEVAGELGQGDEISGCAVRSPGAGPSSGL